MTTGTPKDGKQHKVMYSSCIWTMTQSEVSDIISIQNSCIRTALIQNSSQEDTKLSSTTASTTTKTSSHATSTTNSNPPGMLIPRQRFVIPIQSRYNMPTHRDPIVPPPYLNHLVSPLDLFPIKSPTRHWG